MPDAKTVGTRDAMHVCNGTAEPSGKPAQHLSKFASREHLDENDRSCHELEVLDFLEDAACYDLFCDPSHFNHHRGSSTRSNAGHLIPSP